MIGAIAAKMTRASPRATAPAPNVDALDDSLELGRLMRLSWEYCDGKREPPAISEQVELGAKSAFGAA